MKKNKKYFFKDVPLINQKKSIHIYYANRKTMKKEREHTYADTYPGINEIRIVDWQQGIPTWSLIHEIIHNSVYDKIYEEDIKIQKRWSKIIKTLPKKGKYFEFKDTYDEYEAYIQFLTLYFILRDLNLLFLLKEDAPEACKFVKYLIRKCSKQ